MKEKVKEKLLLLSILLLCFVFVVWVSATVFHEARRARAGICEYQIQNFKSSKQAFETVATELLDIYSQEKSNNGELKSISVLQASGGIELRCKTASGNYTVSKTTTEEYRNAESEVREALLSEKRRGLTYITVTSDSVTFHTESPYYIIYVKNGSRPDGSDFTDRLSFRFFEALEK